MNCSAPRCASHVDNGGQFCSAHRSRPVPRCYRDGCSAPAEGQARRAVALCKAHRLEELSHLIADIAIGCDEQGYIVSVDERGRMSRMKSAYDPEGVRDNEGQKECRIAIQALILEGFMVASGGTK